MKKSEEKKLRKKAEKYKAEAEEREIKRLLDEALQKSLEQRAE